MSMQHTIRYTPFSDPAMVITDAVNYLASLHPNAGIEIFRMEITAGLPKNDHGQTIGISYRLVNDDDPRLEYRRIFFAS